MNHGGGPRSLAALLSQSPALRPNPGRVTLHQWRQAVGERVAAKTRAGRLNEGTLSVVVATSAWAQELSLLSSTILERLRSLGIIVTRLRFTVGAITPIAREAVVERVQKVTLPPALAARLERIEDTELRAAIAEAAAYGLARSI